LRALQKEFFRAPDLGNAQPRWARRGGGVRRATKATG